MHVSGRALSHDFDRVNSTVEVISDNVDSGKQRSHLLKQKILKAK